MPGPPYSSSTKKHCRLFCSALQELYCSMATVLDISPQVSTLSKKEKNYDGAAKAKFNFTAQTPMELSFLKGDNFQSL